MSKEQIGAFFDALAPAWDDHQRTDPAKLDRILTAAGVGPEARILDVACGTGVLAPYYLDRGAGRILGVDLSREMIRQAEKKFGADPRVTFRTGDGETLDPGGTFDCILVYNALPHFPDLAALICNLARYLGPGGRLTLAHDRGREALLRHHTGVPAGVARPIPTGAELGTLMTRAGLFPREIADEEDFFLVTGEKQP